MNRETLIKKLFFKSSYMGCKENDIVFGNFAKTHLNDMSEEELLEYQELLEENDADLFAYIAERQEFPNKYSTSLINKIKAFKVHEII